MKCKFLLTLIPLLWAGTLSAQWTSNSEWNYDFGTRETAVEYVNASTTAPAWYASPQQTGSNFRGAFAAAPPSGSAGIGIHHQVNEGKITLKTDKSLELQMGQTSQYVRFSATGIPTADNTSGVATAVAMHSFTLAFGSNTTGYLTYAIGNSSQEGATNFMATNSSSNLASVAAGKAAFASLRFTYANDANSNNVALTYRASNSSSNVSISSAAFQKNTAYAIRLFFNNSGVDQDYDAPDGSEQTVLNGYFHIWKSDNDGTTWTRIPLASGTENYDIPKNNDGFAEGSPFDSFFFGTYNSNSGAVVSSTATFTLSNMKLVYKNLTTSPVSLTFFRGSLQANSVKLDWQTASESNNSHFDVERSADGMNFTKITSISGKGNSNEILNYSYTDAYPLQGINYYRLKQIDNDGTSAYVGDVLAIKANISEESYQVFLTDKNTLNIIAFSDKKLEGSFRIYDTSGRTILKSKISLENGSNKFMQDVSKLSSGIYVAALNVGGQELIKKIVK